MYDEAGDNLEAAKVPILGPLSANAIPRTHPSHTHELGVIVQGRNAITTRKAAEDYGQSPRQPSIEYIHR